MKLFRLLRSWLLVLREVGRNSVLGSLWQLGLLKVVTRQDMVTQPEHYRVQTFGQAHTLKPPLPITVDAPPDLVVPMTNQAITLEPPFVAELRDVYLVGKAGVCVGSQGEVYMESVMPNSIKNTLSFDALPLRTVGLRTTASQDSPTMDLACSLVHSWGRQTYAHWLLECLPRLEGLHHYEQTTGEKVPLLVHSPLKSWQRDSLALMGYGPDHYQTWDGQRLKVKRLILPSFRRQCRWSEPDAFDWMRQRMIAHLPPPTEQTPALSPRILISRGNAVGRCITNEAEVLALLTSYGFKSYVTDALSFADEVRLFSQAEAVIGTHGSGLINMIFATKKPIILDLYSACYTESFFQATSSLGFPYACLYCEPAPGADSGQKSSDMIVNIDKFKQLLHRLFPNG